MLELFREEEIGLTVMEAWSCAELVRSIKTMGGTISENKGDTRLDGLLGETIPASVRGFLAEMKTRHLANIETCERLAESLRAV
jgi:hypothetical protein